MHIFFNRYFSNSLLLYNLFACLLVYCLPYSLVCSKQNNRTRGEKDKTIGQEKIKKTRTREEKKDSGISNIDADNNIDTTPTQVYDLSGRAVNKASQRGVFIFKTKKGAVKVVKK